MFELSFTLPIEPSLLLLLCVVGLVAGFIDAVVGGGGMLTIPALLSAGLPPHVALGTNKLAATFASSTAAWTYYKKQLFDPKFWRQSFLATGIGAIAGTLAVNFVSTELLEKALPLVILATAIYTIFSRFPSDSNHTLPTENGALRKKQWLQGVSLGFYDGIAGPGAGAFWTVSSAALYKINILLASGLAKSMNFTSNILSLITFIMLGHINWMLGLSMGACLMIGAYLGAHSAIRFGGKFIRPIFVCVVIVMAVKLAIEAW